MRLLKAKWAGRCGECERAFEAGAEIAWTGQAFHPDCFKAMLEKQAAEDREANEFQARHFAELRAGLKVRSVANDKEIMVTGAVDAKMARAEAEAFVCSVRAAGGKARLVGHTRNGKRYVGREVVTYYGMSNIGHHEGWAYRYVVE